MTTLDELKAAESSAWHAWILIDEALEMAAKLHLRLQDESRRAYHAWEEARDAVKAFDAV